MTREMESGKKRPGGKAGAGKEAWRFAVAEICGGFVGV